MHIHPLLPVSMTMLALSGAALSLPIPTPQEGSSLDIFIASRADEQSPLHRPPRSPSPPPMIQVFDPAGEIKEVIQTGPQRTGGRGRRRVNPYDKGTKGPRKPKSKAREEDAVKQADKLALDLAGLKLNSRTQS